MNDFWLQAHPSQSYAESAHMPVVVATSSIAFQRAIVLNYIPALSDILLENGVIALPLTCVIRKGREHYLCEQRLRTFLVDADERTIKLLEPLAG